MFAGRLIRKRVGRGPCGGIGLAEGLLLLSALTKANADIQKIVAFENAFDRLFTIIYDEGLSDGGIIVADCINLMLNLLRQNASNQVGARSRLGCKGEQRTAD